MNRGRTKINGLILQMKNTLKKLENIFQEHSKIKHNTGQLSYRNENTV